MDRFKKAAEDFRGMMWLMAFFSFFSNLLMLAIPLYMLQIYDRVLPSQSSNTLVYLSILAVLALLVLGAMEIVRSILANRAAARMDATLGDAVLHQVIKTGSLTGGSAQPMRDLAAIRNLVSSRQIFSLLDLPFASIFIALLYFVHPDLFWLTLAGALILALLAIVNQLVSNRAVTEQNEKHIGAAMQTEYLARNADSLVAMGMVKNVINYWGNSHADAMEVGDRSARINAFFMGLSRFIRLGIQIAILGYGALLVLRGEMTPGMIFASSIISGRALQPIDQVIGAWRAIAGGMQSWKRLKLFLSASVEDQSYTPLPQPKGFLQVQGVLQPNAIDTTAKPVLARVSFDLEPGKSVAVIGPSGSGKSTLARIIVGALKPYSGSVRLDGNDITNWDPEDLGRYIGYLAQDVELLPGTIAQNISRFEPDPDPEAIMEAARLAHVEDLIKNMPRGFDTPIGPGGAQISGGEKQRIGLARAFYGSPRLLVLDEPNSSLDRFGEIALLKAVAEAKKNGITVFIISQRESALANVDKIMRMQAGAILDYDDRDVIIRKFSQPQQGAESGASKPENTPDTKPALKSPGKANGSGTKKNGNGSTFQKPVIKPGQSFGLPPKPKSGD